MWRRQTCRHAMAWVSEARAWEGELCLTDWNWNELNETKPFRGSPSTAG